MGIAEWCMFGAAFLTGIVLLYFVLNTESRDVDTVREQIPKKKGENALYPLRFASPERRNGIIKNY